MSNISEAENIIKQADKGFEDKKYEFAYHLYMGAARIFELGGMREKALKTFQKALESSERIKNKDLQGRFAKTVKEKLDRLGVK